MNTTTERAVEQGFCLLSADHTIRDTSPQFRELWSRLAGQEPEAGRSLFERCGEDLRRRLSEVLASAAKGTERAVRLPRPAGDALTVTASPLGDGILLALIGPDPAARSDSEAQMARLASRLQAVLASAVELDSSIHDTATIYRTTFENLSAAMPFDTGTIQMLVDEELHVVAAWGFEDPDDVVGMRFPLDDRFPNYHVISGRNALALDDIRIDFPHFLTQEGEFESGHIRTWIGVPLLDRGQVIGMITMDRRAIEPFDPDEIELAQALANHAAVALSNARMYDSLQKANDLQHMLLRELHHRVKNNLQLVSSLLNLRSLDIDEQAGQILGELRTHIQALASTHDNIFQPGLSEDVLLEPYVADIIRGIEVGYIPAGRRITVAPEIQPSAHCGMGLAVPIGLIVSELVLNAVKHAFVGHDGPGTITVTLEDTDNEIRLGVADDGRGFPAHLDGDGAALPEQGGFGLTLVSTLVQQIDARISREPRTSGAARPGTRWTLIVSTRT